MSNYTWACGQLHITSKVRAKNQFSPAVIKLARCTKITMASRKQVQAALVARKQRRGIIIMYNSNNNW